MRLQQQLQQAAEAYAALTAEQKQGLLTQLVPGFASNAPQAFAAQVRVRHVVSAPQSLATLHCTQAPAPSQTEPPF